MLFNPNRSDDVIPRTLSLGEFAAAVGIHRNTVRRLLQRGAVQGTRTGREWEIPASEVERVRASYADSLDAHAAAMAAIPVLISEAMQKAEYAEEAMRSVFQHAGKTPDGSPEFANYVERLRELLAEWDEAVILKRLANQFGQRVIAGAERTIDEIEDDGGESARAAFAADAARKREVGEPTAPHFPADADDE